MAIVEMTRAQVIKVLRKERLTHGTFGSSPNYNENDPADKKGCTYCAVGQVVRAAMRTTTPVVDVQICAVRATDNVKICDLERAFEHARLGIGGDPDGNKGRKAAIAYVRANFPARIRIDIGNAKPRRGMRVVW